MCWAADNFLKKDGYLPGTCPVDPWLFPCDLSSSSSGATELDNKTADPAAYPEKCSKTCLDALAADLVSVRGTCQGTDKKITQADLASVTTALKENLSATPLSMLSGHPTSGAENCKAKIQVENPPVKASLVN